MQVVDEMIHAATNDVLATLELIEEVMATRSIQTSETQHRRRRESRREHRALTGEHGIGLHKQGFLVDEAGAGAVETMRLLKRALDPKNILNPGKIFSL